MAGEESDGAESIQEEEPRRKQTKQSKCWEMKRFWKNNLNRNLLQHETQQALLCGHTFLVEQAEAPGHRPSSASSHQQAQGISRPQRAP